MSDIAILLPFAETFSLSGSGAIGIGACNTTRHSQYRDRITIYGRPVAQPFDGVRFHGLIPRGRWFRGRNRGLAAALWHAVRRTPPALVETRNRPQVFDWLVRHTGLATSIHFHNDPQDMMLAGSPTERQAIADRAAAIYCVSQFVRDRFLDGLDRPPRHLHVLYNGIERPWTTPPAKEPMIVFAGRLIPDKGALEFARAMARLLPGRPDWRAVMIGGYKGGSTGAGAAYAADVERTFRAIGDQASFLGYQPYDVTMDHFARASIVVVPSIWNEPFGRTAAEALAAGSALVSSPRGGLREIVEGRGLVLDTVSDTEIAARIDGLIAEPCRLAALQERAWNDFPFHIVELTRTQDAIRTELLKEANRCES